MLFALTNLYIVCYLQKTKNDRHADLRDKQTSQEFYPYKISILYMILYASLALSYIQFHNLFRSPASIVYSVLS